MEYRKDIQILRGISVLLVVLFHLEIGGFKSGFLGVDVFFVISGYLMAIFYNPERKWEFFVKRARRLLPAYFAIIVVTLLACMLITTPNDYDSVIKQTLFATFFTSNIGYWTENSYFSKSAFNPLLHLWSLGVEIQFYLLLPFLYWLFSKIRGSYFIVLLGSLAACFYVVEVSPKTAFFMLPFRLWEFLLGYGIAKLVFHGTLGKNEAMRWLGVAGLILLLAIPMIKVDGNAVNFIQGHPGLSALSVCLATALILGFGLPPVVENLRIAGWLEKLGQYSYSIYLIHFPLIVLFLYKPFSGTVLHAEAYWQTAVLVGSIIILSKAMYTFIENPLRSKPNFQHGLILCCIVILISGPLGTVFQIMTIPEKEMLIYKAWTDRSEYRCGKIKRILDPSAISCEITEPLDKPHRRIMLVGNSHADSIKDTFKSVAQARNLSVRFVVSNSPLMVNGITPENLIKEAKLHQIDTLIFHYAPGSVDPSIIRETVSLADAQNISSAFIMPVPVWRDHIPMALWKHLKLNDPLPSANLIDYQTLNQGLIQGLAAITNKKWKIYQVANYLCTNDCKMSDASGKPLYFDSGHLTLTGSEYLRKVFEQIVEDVIDLAK